LLHCVCCAPQLPLLTGTVLSLNKRDNRDPIRTSTAWIVGEYAAHIPVELRESVIDTLIQVRGNTPPLSSLWRPAPCPLCVLPQPLATSKLLLRWLQQIFYSSLACVQSMLRFLVLSPYPTTPCH
jgi:hypothetical protein